MHIKMCRKKGDVRVLYRIAVILLMMMSMSSVTLIAAQKYSKKGSGSCPGNEAVIQITANDASRGTNNTSDFRWVKGDSGFTDGSGIDANTMYLNCDGTVVALNHDSVQFQTDTNTSTTSFSKIQINGFNQTAIESLALDGKSMWCSLFIPQASSTCVWEFPSALRLDRLKPNISGTHLVTGVLTPMSEGRVKWTWAYNDPTNSSDVDGPNSSMCEHCASEECYKCNKSDERGNIQLFRRSVAGQYEDPAVTVSTDNDSAIDPGPATLNDRFVEFPDEFCYVMRVSDTAGNYTATLAEINTDGDTLSKEKCVYPDGKYPSFISTEYYKNYTPGVGFSNIFKVDSFSRKFLLTSNPCYYSPTCDMTVARNIYIKLVSSEPLFDGVNPYGYMLRVSDGFDNDNDGLTDEETGGYNGIDDDGDGLIDEDVAITTVTYAIANDDKKDNDADGYVDEHPNSLAGADSTASDCNAHELYSRPTSECLPAPRATAIGIDNEGEITGPANTNPVLTWICTSDNVTTHPECSGLPYGQSVYLYTWNVGRAGALDINGIGIEDGDYSITFTAADGVGNVTTAVAPGTGAETVFDNTGPSYKVEYFTSSAFTDKFRVVDHDNKPATPDMPILPLGDTYLLVTGNDYAGATPSVYIFKPDARIPVYEGIPQPGDYVSPQLYKACNQNANCDLCTGTGCDGYDPAVEMCMSFKGCLSIDESYNNGYAGVTVKGKDQSDNHTWDPDNTIAQANRYDQDKKGDDTGLDGIQGTGDDYDSDGVPTYGVEPDTALIDGSMFAIDIIAPATPSISLPIAPCDNSIARANMSCLPSASPVNNPTLKWTVLSNDKDDDLDERIDEECVDGLDDDGDGVIDEDGRICNDSGTAGWEVRQWRLQISTSPDFSTYFKDSMVSGTTLPMTAMPERSLAAPYYWRIAAYDMAGNLGPWNPYATGTQQPYYTFGVDITSPKINVAFYEDESCTTPITLLPEGYPAIGDTQNDPDRLVCLKLTADEPLGSSPLVEISQAGYSLISTGTVLFASGANPVYITTFEVDAKGAGAIFSDGFAYIYTTAVDEFGNTATHVAPQSGERFYVDAVAPQCELNTVDPSPASSDNDRDGIKDELVQDALTISMTCNKYIGPTAKIRVKQNNFSSTSTMDDMIDNDCDGRIDEENTVSSDIDNDGLIGEDLGSTGARPGSGCLITTTFSTGTAFVYSGKYNVVSKYYDGAATVYIGDTNPTSQYYLKDLIGNPIYSTGQFEVDTTAPASPTLVSPAHNQVLNNGNPQMGWRMEPRVSDLKNYTVEISTSSSFATLAATAEVGDSGSGTSFYHTISQYDIISGADKLPDGKYYWRVFSRDQAFNKSDSSLVYTFYVDTTPPSVPVFTEAETVTTTASTPLKGSTSPAEPNSKVYIFVNTVYVGFVTTDSAGKFTVGIDDDSDGMTDEDPIDTVDNDFDGLTDEDPLGIFLNEGINVIEGFVVDTGGNEGPKGCSPSSTIYDSDLSQCIVRRDSGPPSFIVTYYSDLAFTQPLAQNPATGRQIAKAGTVYLRINSSELLETEAGGPNPPTFTVNFPGTTDKGTTLATPVNGSKTEFVGTVTVNAAAPPSHVDGDAEVYVKGFDREGNETPDGSLPAYGAYFTVDTTLPILSTSFYSNTALTETMKKDETLTSVIKAGKGYVKIVSSEKLLNPPLVSIDQPGTNDIIDAPTTAIDTSKLNFRYEYTAITADGTANIDGTRTITVNATDLAGNTASAIVPSVPAFKVDTTPPNPPALILSTNSTIYTSIMGSGSVTKPDGYAESYATVESFVSLSLPMSPSDGIDNDGDGRVDEEPNGINGIDDDGDGFTDEDISSSTCATGKIWDTVMSECINPSVYKPTPDGTATTDSSGGFNISITGIKPGANYIYTRATDIAGNVSAFGTPILLAGVISESIRLTHTYPAGWNLVGIPLQPAAASPNSALSLLDVKFYQFKGGQYISDLGIDPAAPGVCYWAFFPTEKTAVSQGVTSTTNAIHLAAGWNLIAIPYNLDVRWDDNMMVYYQENLYQIGTSAANLLIEPYIYEYDGNSVAPGYSAPISVTDGFVMKPWIGYAVKALTESWLVFPDQFGMARPVGIK